MNEIKYLHLKFSELNNSEGFEIRIGENLIPIHAKSGKWFANIQIDKNENFQLTKGDSSKVELLVTNEKVFHPDQIVFDEKYGIKSHLLEGESLCYATLGNKVNPTHILVTFPGVSNFDNVNYRLSALTSIQHLVSRNTLIIAFQDKEAVYGNYMYKTPAGYPIKAIGISLLRGLAVKYGIDDSKIIFYGNSKGGSIAIDFIESFPLSKFFVDIPQLDFFNYKSQNEIMRYSIGVASRNYYNYLNYLPSMNNLNVNYSFAENDFDASRGLVMSKFPGINVNMLKDMGHSNAAMEFVKRQFSKIFQIINEDFPVLRPSISCDIKIEGDKLFLKRRLPAIKNTEQFKKLYAEINFSNGKNIYSVSLNKIFDDDAASVFWEKGLEFLKHLSDDVYQISLTLYLNYREIVYPVNKNLIVKGTDSKIISI